MTEVAPGIDHRNQVVPAVGFPFGIADRLREMDVCLFTPGQMGLKDSAAWK